MDEFNSHNKLSIIGEFSLLTASFGLLSRGICEERLEELPAE